MSIIKLNNPKTEHYNNLKKFILSFDFTWSHLKEFTPQGGKDIDHTNQCHPEFCSERNFDEFTLYTHAFLHRPTRDTLYSKQYSPYLDDIIKLLGEIFNANAQIMDHFNMMVRCSANATHPEQKYIKTSLHTDHDFPHKNMLIYLTDAGGNTFVEDEEFAPEEDDVIIFEGEHCHELPKQKRRGVLVMTYI